MPFYLKKSVSVGPFRFNFSNNGVGLSVGVRGLRIGTGPRGHYVHAGRGGLYYRSSLSGSTNKTPRAVVPSKSGDRGAESWRSQNEPTVEMFRVSSSDVMGMHDARFADLLADLNEKQNTQSKSVTLGLAGGALALFLAMVGGSLWFALGAGLAAVAAAVGAWMDSYQRAVVLMYHLEDDASRAYQAVVRAFDDISKCSGKWHIDAGGAVYDPHAQKRNAGASHLVDKHPTVPGYSLPRVVKSNIVPPSLPVGKETIYFLPDVALVVEKNKVGAVGYDSLNIQWQDSRFIEEGNVPADTTVVGRTWKYPNKNGGPDRRFSGNVELPICLYESIHLTSPNGLNELIQLSRTGLGQPFAAAIRSLGAANGSDEGKLAIPKL